MGENEDGIKKRQGTSKEGQRGCWRPYTKGSLHIGIAKLGWNTGDALHFRSGVGWPATPLQSQYHALSLSLAP